MSKERFKFVYKDCGHGAGGKVSVVKRESDGKLLIWKRPKYNSPKYQESYRREIKRIKTWRKIGISKVKVCWHPDKKSILKTYVKGPTLRQLLKKYPDFFSMTDKKSVKELIKFLKNVVNSGYYIHDLKGANIVFDGDRWQVIDSGPLDHKSSLSSARKEYMKNLLEKWSRSLPKKKVNHLRSFLKKYCR